MGGRFLAQTGVTPGMVGATCIMPVFARGDMREINARPR
jgi:hypothetical protein